MNRTELETSLRKLRLSGMADSLEARCVEAKAGGLGAVDLLAALVSDELVRRQDRLIARRIKAARFRDRAKTLDSFDFAFNAKINRKLVCDLATARFVAKAEECLMLGPPGTGKSHIAQAIGHAAILQGYRVLYREAHTLLEDIAQATVEDRRREYMREIDRAELLIVDDIGMRKLPATAAEDLLEVVMRRYERSSTVLTSNRPVEDWGTMLGDTPAVTALLDRMLDHGHVLKCGPKSYRMQRRKSLRAANASE